METAVADLLDKAVDALESGRIKWGQYDPPTLNKPPGTNCAAETIDIVARELGLRVDDDLLRDKDPGDLADEAVSLHVTKGRDANHLTSWNDTQARTVGDVIQAFKETANKIRNGKVS